VKEIVMLDQRIISLMQELPNHPALYERMKEAERQGAKAHSTIFTTPTGHDDIPLIQSFEQGLGFIAAELDVIVHGDYTYEDICILCDKMHKRLLDRRTIVLNTEAPKHKALEHIVIPPGYKH